MWMSPWGSAYRVTTRQRRCTLHRLRLLSWVMDTAVMAVIATRAGANANGGTVNGAMTKDGIIAGTATIAVTVIEC